MDQGHPNSSVALDVRISRDTVPASPTATEYSNVGRTEREDSVPALPTATECSNEERTEREDLIPASPTATECSNVERTEWTQLETKVLLGADATGQSATATLEVEIVSGPPISGPEHRYRRVAIGGLALAAVVGLLYVVYALIIVNGTDRDSVPQWVVPTGRFAVGTHNSYHVAPASSVLEALINFGKAAIANEINVTQPSLTEQLGLGLESFELDVYADPQGGLYLTPWVTSVGLEQQRSAISQAKMKLPGWKVFHVQDLDTRSTCLTLNECLQAFRDFPRTRTVYVMLEIKYETLALPLPIPLTTPLDPRVHPELWKSLEDEVRPLANGNPPVRFLIDNPELSKQYVQLRPNASTRVLLPNMRRFEAVPEGWSKDEVFVQCNNPLAGHRDWNLALGADIMAVVEQGFLVRTRSDTSGNFNEARARAAFESGAKIIQTDAIAATLEFRDQYYAGDQLLTR